ncbi:MAG: putative DNA binding domain-containing protein [Desulfomonile sp.]|nr:putative DNA binding domain-containing protein [Desulfomonile sp.]
MDEEELESLLLDLESDRVERKASLSDTDRIAQAICAFANDMPDHRMPGVLFVGVDNEGRCASLPITDQLLRTLADIRDNGKILPLPHMTVQKRTLNGCELAVVIVQPSDAPPVRYRGKVWIRVGPRRAIATAEEEARLSEKRRARDLPFDLRPFPSATIDDLDMDLFSRTYLPSEQSPEVLAANDRSAEHKLMSVRFLSSEPERAPTALGILVVGQRPRDFIPGDYVQFLRIDGTDLTDPIKDQKEIDGPLPELVRRMEDVLEAHISVASDYASHPVETKKPDYPIEALRQLARNALMHRTYEASNAPVRVYWFKDRIEIHSPGGPSAGRRS